ncbi:Pescadillo N-terminus-domain-containing protein [Polychytrium aggregatum]|uniref:Pescadillo N-terminus-domain-containing protein n=1 Tax=Polychytrium aggregatum TaxID=110093 RepID=UPI0022FEA172|nr:Pescadillo N-terminus-domain-containing protein [Polychytrium aggregatum]KAI9205545.1 Pescadillo N-terminus-domain-containing protein [Polychytrium aggregatum]
MGKIKKKGESGAVSNFITRTAAVRKLQVSLATFRRLCILKGIYPREPKNKKKVGKGSTAPRTYYYRKDIQYLLHEPILYKLREQKTFAKKLTKLISKKEWSSVDRLREQKPNYTVNHLIKERYPSFVDAIRDLDDALSMVFLFSTLPAGDKVQAHHVQKCQRLAAEFQNWVVTSRALKRVFLSIKGIYYEVEIKGQPVLWITPYQFSQNIPTDVDFRVMQTFLELYETLLGFVNFKLYSELNLIYPPKLDDSLESGAVGLSSLILQSAQGREVLDALEKKQNQAEPEVRPTHQQKAKTGKRLESLNAKISQIQSTDDNDSNGNDDGAAGPEEDENTLGDSVPQPIASAQADADILPSISDIKHELASADAMQKLFSGCIFWLSREVPRYSLEFVIRACGGQVGWDATSGAGSPFREDDPRITHHIIDRPLTDSSSKIDTREYLQPQWIYDCVNAKFLVKTRGYHPGEVLPPHMSPFAVLRDGDYVPPEAQANEQEAEGAEKGEDEDAEGVDDEDDEDDEDDVEEENDGDEDEEAIHKAELEAEAAGVSFSEYVQQKGLTGAGKANAGSKKRKSTQEDEEKELAKMMMSKRDKHLYSKIQYGKKRREVEAEKLRARRQQIDKEAKQKQQQQKKAKKPTPKK